ncbi:MAG TPA: Uma2 family endonuclease [Thermoanaerobaculia bacterium]|nr:Uma2 family endonuclease [Thermoanaerobaculia bacterium]
MLQRWVERPGGGFEPVEMPLTLELYLNPRLEDKTTQGELHADLLAELKELLGRYFKPQRDVKVLMDVKHLVSPRKGPSPDISIVRGVRNPGRKLTSFNIAKEGVVPSLVIEVISPIDARVRQMDEVDKVKLYERIGIPEYLLVDPPRQANGHRFLLKGYRLDRLKRYQGIEPDAQGCLHSETTELIFGVSAPGDRIEVFNARTGERLESPAEAVERAAYEAKKAAHEAKRAIRETTARKIAEERAAREAKKAAQEEAARKAAEARATAAEEELVRLRAQIERLKKSGH